MCRWVPLLIAWCGAFATGRQAPAHRNGIDCSGPVNSRLVQQLPESSFQASSQYATFNPHDARITATLNSNAWCPAPALKPNALAEWILVTFDSDKIIHMLLTEPRLHKELRLGEFTKRLVIQYRRTEAETFRNYTLLTLQDGVWQRERLLSGNRDLTDKRNFVNLRPPIVARQVRIFPVNSDAEEVNVCLRFELYGSQQYQGVLAYSGPQGHSSRMGNFSDKYYDGELRDGRMIGGLGQLTDGLCSDKRPTATLDDADAGTAFVGWSRRLLGADFVELEFEFDRVRLFHQLAVKVSNDFERFSARQFSSISISFSLYGGVFSRWSSRNFRRIDDPSTRDVVLALSTMGRFVRVRMHFAADWILVGEFSFTSSVVVPPPPQTTRQPQPPPRTQPPVVTRRRGGGGTEPLDIGQASGELAYILVIVSSLLAAALLLLAVGLLCLRRRQLRAKQRRLSAHLKHSDTVHLDFGSGRPAVLLNGKSLGVYSSLPESDDDDDDDDDLGEKDGGYGRSLFRPEAREYASATLCGHHAAGSPPPPYPARPQNSGRPMITQNPLADLAAQMARQQQQQQQQQQQMYSPHLPYAARGNLQQQPHVEHLPYPAQLQLMRTSPPPVPRFPSDLNIQGCSGNTVYACPAHLQGGESDNLAELEVSLSSVSLKERIGGGQFGDVRLAEWRPAQATAAVPVAVKTLRPEASAEAREDFRREMRILARLRDPNIVRVLGVVTKDPNGPQCILVEYMQHGDLHQLLRRVPASAMDPAVSYGCLIHLASQVASGMKYLEAMQLVHRDLACRNCLLSAGFQVKIGDFGMSRQLYSAHYYRIEGRTVLPIRWMAWEAVLHGRFTTRSDVWSFAVTLWEMLTFCREQPFGGLSDEEVVANCQHILACDGAAQPLPCPPTCPREIYDLMCECWQRDEACRPQFREIHLFLQRKNIGFVPQDDQLLQMLV